MERAMGKSYADPSLRISAGAKLIITFLRGKKNPICFKADSTRRMDSLIVESGRPTKKHLVPWLTLVSMVINEADTPKTELPYVFASIVAN